MSISAQSLATFFLQLLGLNAQNLQQSSYGDDAEMDSNYPIVEYIDTHGNFHYAQSFNWSSTDVQTGSTMDSTNYTLPAGVPAGTVIRGRMKNPSSLALAPSPGRDPFRFLITRPTHRARHRKQNP
jgi:hypothetical protein